MKNVKSKAEAAISRLDMYGQTISFNLNGNSSIGSCLGGVMTIITFLFTLFIILYNFITWIKNREPIAISQEEYRNVTITEQIPHSSIELGLGLSIFEVSPNPLEFKLDGIDMKNTKSTLYPVSSSNIEIKGQMKNCLNSNSQLLRESFISQYGDTTGNIYCSDFSDNTDDNAVELVSDPLNTGSVKSFSVNTEIDICSIPSQQVGQQFDCSSKDSQLSLTKLGKHKMIVYYKDNFPDMYTYEGSSTDIIAEVITMDFTSNYNIVFTVRKNIIETDRNIIFNLSENDLNTVYSLVVNVWPVTKPTEQPTSIMKVNFRYEIDRKVTYINRGYRKLDALIADSYAMYGFVYVVSSLVVAFFDLGKAEFYLINRLYDYSGGSSTSFSKSMTNQKPRSESNTGRETDQLYTVHKKLNSAELNNKDPIQSINSKSIEQGEQANQPKRKHLKRNLLSLICSKYFPCKSKSQYDRDVEIGYEYLERDTNLLVILRKLINVEKAMRVLFSKEQLGYLELIENRRIDEDHFPSLNESKDRPKPEVVSCLRKLNEQEQDEMTKRIITLIRETNKN